MVLGLVFRIYFLLPTETSVEVCMYLLGREYCYHCALISWIINRLILLLLNLIIPLDNRNPMSIDKVLFVSFILVMVLLFVDE